MNHLGWAKLNTSFFPTPSLQGNIDILWLDRELTNHLGPPELITLFLPAPLLRENIDIL